jgi:MoxR-like ATPase
MRKRKTFDIRASQIESIDLRGCMRIKNDRTEWCAPVFLPSEENCIINLEELNSARPEVFAAFYQLVLDRRLGEYILPKGTWIVASGNRETDRSVVNRMPVALELRFMHCELIYDQNCQELWMIRTGQPIEMVAWNRFRPDRMAYYDPAEKSKGKPVPRQWEQVGKFVKLYHANKDLQRLQRSAAACVGEPDAIEFTAFIEDYKDLPDPRKVLADPAKAKIPKKLSVLVALTAALAKLVNETTAAAFFAYAERLMGESHTEHAIAMTNDAYTRSPKIKETVANSQWQVKYGHLYA